MKVLVAGDYCDRYRVSDKIRQGDYASLFDDVKPVIESADIRIVNFEFPVVLNEGKPIPKCGPNLKGQKESIDAIKYAGFNVCTLANNHILDQGEECCLDTKRLIEEAGMRTVGAGRNLTEASEILYIEQNGETLAVINCCEHEFSIATDSAAGANPLNPIQQYYKIAEARQKADYVLVIVHGGHEHFQLPSPRMKETYRFFIDAGADAVINHHQHCFSGYEEYKGKTIFYGLGNFLFDEPTKNKCIWNEGYCVMMDFNRDSVSFDLFPFIQCNDNPRVELLSRNGCSLFHSKISELNKIIVDNTKLKESHEKWIKDTKAAFEIQLTPWNTHLTKTLFYRGFLPSFMTETKKNVLINFIECESHHDKMIYVLKNL